MQQLFSAFGIDWRFLAAQAVNFGIVLIALWYFLYQPVLRTLEERRRVVAKGVEDAEHAREKLARADSEAAERVKAADTEAQEIVRAGRMNASLARSELLKEAEIRAAAIATDATARAADAAAKMLRESEREIARLSLLAAEKVLRQKHD